MGATIDSLLWRLAPEANRLPVRVGAPIEGNPRLVFTNCIEKPVGDDRRQVVELKLLGIDPGGCRPLTTASKRSSGESSFRATWARAPGAPAPLQSRKHSVSRRDNSRNGASSISGDNSCRAAPGAGLRRRRERDRAGTTPEKCPLFPPCTFVHGKFPTGFWAVHKCARAIFNCFRAVHEHAGTSRDRESGVDRHARAEVD